MLSGKGVGSRRILNRLLLRRRHRLSGSGKKLKSLIGFDTFQHSYQHQQGINRGGNYGESY